MGAPSCLPAELSTFGISFFRAQFGTILLHQKKTCAERPWPAQGQCVMKFVDASRWMGCWPAAFAMSVAYIWIHLVHDNDPKSKCRKSMEILAENQEMVPTLRRPCADLRREVWVQQGGHADQHHIPGQKKREHAAVNPKKKRRQLDLQWIHQKYWFNMFQPIFNFIVFNFAILLPYSSILFHLPEILMAPQGKNRHLFQEKPIITLDQSKPAWLAPGPPSRSPRPTARGSPGSVRWEGPGTVGFWPFERNHCKTRNAKQPWCCAILLCVSTSWMCLVHACLFFATSWDSLHSE